MWCVFRSHLFLIQHLLLEFLSQLRLLIYLIILNADNRVRETHLYFTTELVNLAITNYALQKLKVLGQSPLHTKAAFI